MFSAFFPEFFEWWHIPVIFLTGIVGEGIGCVVGGGSIFMQSVPIFLGVPLHSAIALDNGAQLATDMGIFSQMYKTVLQRKKLVLWMLVPVSLGGIIGTFFLSNLPQSVIKYTMIGAVLFLLFNQLFLKNIIHPEKLEKYRMPLLVVIMFLIGIYTNFIGVGEATFTKITLISVLGLTFIESHGLKSIVVFPARVYSLVVMGLKGFIIWPYLFTFWVSNFFVGRYVTKYIQRVPEKYLKGLITTFAVLFLIKLILT